MRPFEQIAVTMTVMRQLAEVMEQERALLRAMRLDALQDLQAEKAVLADAYEVEIERLRKSPETLGALDMGTRRELEEAMRGFQATLKRNADALVAAKAVIEQLMQAVGESLEAGRAVGGTYPRAAQAPQARGGNVIAVAFDRTI